jgi:hypothetical protein
MLPARTKPMQNLSDVAVKPTCIRATVPSTISPTSHPASTPPMNSVQYWIGVVASLSGLIVGLVTALWVYAKFVVERGLLPPVQFWIDCKAFGSKTGKRLLEISIHLKNVGSSTLIATDIRVDVLYVTTEDTFALSDKETSPNVFGRFLFPRSLRKDLLKAAQLEAVPVPPPREDVPKRSPNRRPGADRDGFYVIPYDTFVQSHIDEVYTFATAVPSSTSHVLVRSSFRYVQRPKSLQKAMLGVSQKLGLIQFTLADATAPHATERVFELLPDEKTNTNGTEHTIVVSDRN